MTTNDVFDAKADLIDLLRAGSVPAQPLAGVEVSYVWDPLSAAPLSLYGGAVAFENEPAVAEGSLQRETAILWLYARAVHRPPGPVEDTDAAVKGIRVGVEAILKANPKIGGVWSWQGVVAGRGDYSRNDDETVSVLSLQVRLGTYASW